MGYNVFARVRGPGCIDFELIRPIQTCRVGSSEEMTPETKPTFRILQCILLTRGETRVGCILSVLHRV